MADIIESICSDFAESDYFISAIGHRGISREELKAIITIIINKTEILPRLKHLYKYNPSTISMDKEYRKNNCDNFCRYCDCFLPDVLFDNCYCQVERRNKILTSDRRNYPEYIKWRTSVFERDDYTCQNCKQIGGELNAHHILSYKDYPEQRIEINNGVTLCKSCHKKEHSNED